MKRCPRCKKHKPLDCFKDRKNRIGGTTKQSYCIECQKSYAIEKAPRLLTGAYAVMDKKKGLEFDIDEEFTKSMIFKPCVYCGGFSESGYNGLDRLDNTKGHTRENCVTACKECNNARNTYFTHEEMMIIGRAIAEVRKQREIV